MKRLNLFPKIFIYTLTLMLVIVFVAHSLIFFLMPVFYKNQQRNMLESQTETLKKQIQSISEDEIMNALSLFSIKLNVGVKLNYNGNSYKLNFSEILSPNVGIAFSVNSLANEHLYLTIEGDIFIDNNALETQQDKKDFIADNPSYILVNKSFSNQTDDYLSTFISLRAVNDATNVILMLLPITGTICVLISAIFSLIYSRTITNPIKQISSVTQQMEKLDCSAKCEVNTDDEIGLLATNLNLLYQNLLSTIKNLEIEIHKVSEVEKSKTDFLRAASHELKTPVTAINAMLENMILGVGKYKDHEIYLPKCKDMTDQLSIMIKEILDASRLNLNMENEENTVVDVAELIMPIIEPYQIIAKAKGIYFDIELSDSFSICIPQKLFCKAISNILSNAVSYTENKKTISVYFDDNKLIVENECKPIPQEEIVRLTEPFYRLEYAKDRNSGGNGLGLYIVNLIFQTLHINYKFESTDNQQGMRISIQL